MRRRLDHVSERNLSPISERLGHRKIGLDSNVLIYLLETEGPLAEVAAQIVDALAEEEIEAVMSAVGLIEVLTGPARRGDSVAFEVTAEALRELPLRVIPLGAGGAEDAAWIRGVASFDLEDAVHLSASRAAGVTAFVTNDRRIRSIPRLDVIYLDDLIA
jgi:predicted nucleic acid-binding protein